MDNVNTFLKANSFINKIILNKVLYRCFFIFAVMCTAIPYLQENYGQFVKIMLVWGVVILIYDIIFDFKNIIKHKTTICLILFLGVYFISIIINGGEVFTENIKEFIYMILVFLVLFRVSGNNKDQINKEFKYISITTIICTAILGIGCFVTYLFNINTTYIAFNNEVHIGMFENRLWGLYNPNFGAMLALVSIILSGFYIAQYKKKYVYVPLGINILLQYILLILSASRTAIYGGILCTGVLCFGLISLIIPNLKGMTLFNIFKRGIISALVIIILFGFTKASEPIFHAIPQIKTIEAKAEKLENSKSIKKKSTKKKTTKKKTNNNNTSQNLSTNRTDVGYDSYGGILNGRQYIWNGGITVWKTNVLFGVTSKNIGKMVPQHITQATYKRAVQTGGLHNIYLTVLVSSGIIGFLIYIIFGAMYIKRVIYKISFTNNIKSDGWFIASAFLVLLFLIMELFEARTMYTVSTSMILFWTFAGYCLRFSYLQKTKQE